MRLDSQKHASLLGGILKIMNEMPPSKVLWSYQIQSYVDKLAVKKELENHVSLETEVLKHVEEEIQQTKDEGLKLLLQHIAEDEKKHHKILETIVRYAYRIGP
jgi:rubrerythrin